MAEPKPLPSESGGPSKNQRQQQYVYPWPAPAETCPCLACIDVRVRYRSSPRNLHFFGWKLLQHNWTRGTDEVERRYRRAHKPAARAAHTLWVEEGPRGPST